MLGAEVGSPLPGGSQGGEKAGQVARSGGPLPPPSPCWEHAPRSSSPGGGTLATSSACSCFCVLVTLIKACVFEEAGLGEESSEREPT